MGESVIMMPGHVIMAMFGYASPAHMGNMAIFHAETLIVMRRLASLNHLVKKLVPRIIREKGEAERKIFLPASLL